MSRSDAYVEADAAADWTPHDIEAARTAAVACSLDLAANPPPPLTSFTTTKEDVDRHRRIAREAVGF